MSDVVKMIVDARIVRQTRLAIQRRVKRVLYPTVQLQLPSDIGFMRLRQPGEPRRWSVDFPDLNPALRGNIRIELLTNF